MNYCENCSLRLFNTKGYNINGIGTTIYGNCIVVPNVDYAAYRGKDMSFSSQVKVIEEVLLLSTGVEDSNLYITPLIRCNELISCELDTAAYNNCLHYFANDIKTYDFKNILLLGSAARRFLGLDNIKDHLNVVYVSKNNRRYFVNYSPFVKDDLFEVFKTQLQKWYYSISDNYYDYEIIRL